jgi:hypothetical protein
MKRFVIQNNLIAENDLKQVQNACKNNGIDFEEVTVIPFVEELPKFKVDPENIYYGSTTFISNLYKQLKPKGVFFDPDKFLISNYIKQWGIHMLNSGAEITTLHEFVKQQHDNDDDFFIRPNADNKAFDGQVLKFDAIKKWRENIVQFDNLDPLIDMEIVVGEPYNLKKEWRNFIVNGEIVSSSLYRENFKLKKSATDIPESMLNFVNERIKEYQPASAFAMDVALCGDEHFIIECGCINSVGFYHGNIEKIVLALAL